VEPTERFAALVADLADEPGVQPPQAAGKRLFGADTLRVHGSIFAMLSHGALVVKLPAPRVAELIAAGSGSPFDAGKGRPLRNWLTVADDADWTTLAREALTFVGDAAH
jgi:TfoX/Sxy family transcriptional regulator of competence genes